MQDSRWRPIAEKYRKDIETGRLRPGDRLPSDAALAELLSVSRATAHRALSELQRWGLVERLRGSGTVVAAAKEQTPKGVVALVLDQVAHQRDFPHMDLIAGIHDGLGEDTNLLWCDSKLSENREVQFLRQMAEEADGILCWPTGSPKSTAVLKELKARNVPIVLLDRVPGDLVIDCVTNESSATTRRALEFLMGRGHQRIGFFSFHKPAVSTVAERLRSFEGLFAERQWPTSGLIRMLSPDLEFADSNRFLQAVNDALFTMIRSANPITAVFCVQDMFAAAILQCADHMGVRVPEDLEIATYNDWPSMMLQRPWHVHRIVNRTFEIGRTAATRLMQLISGEGDPLPAVQRISGDFFVADAGLLPAPPFVKDGEGATKGG